MSTNFKLKKPPVKEIIFTISFKDLISDENLLAFSKLDEIKSKFPEITPGFNTHVNSPQNDRPTAKILSDGHVLSTSDRKKVLQARRGNFSLNLIVDTYQDYDSIIQEFEHYWNLLNSVCEKLAVGSYFVRYVNFIDLEGEDSNLYLNINLSHPFKDKNATYFGQLQFSYDKNIAATIIVYAGQNNDKKGTILDIIVNKSVIEGIEFNFNKEFYSIRSIKNELFRNSITTKLIDKCNQQ